MNDFEIIKYRKKQHRPDPIKVDHPFGIASEPAELTPFVVHGLCKFSGYESLVGKVLRRQAAWERMRSVFVVQHLPPATSLGWLTSNAFATRSRQNKNQNGPWL